MCHTDLALGLRLALNKNQSKSSTWVCKLGFYFQIDALPEQTHPNFQQC